MNFQSEFKVQRLQLFLFMKELDPQIPIEASELDKYIVKFFFRYFGLYPESITAEKYDLESFKRDVENFRKLTKEWKKNCKGFTKEFLGKPFLKKYVCLKEREPEAPEPAVSEEIPEEVLDMCYSAEDLQSENREDLRVPEPGTSRRKIPFCDMPPSTKRAKTSRLRKTTDPDLLVKAVVQNLNAQGHQAAAQCVERLHNNPAELGPALRKAIIKFDKNEEKAEEDISTLEVLCLILTENMTRKNYIKHRKVVNRKGKILPPYNEVMKAKLECRPIGIATEIHKVDVPLQNLAEHTIQRILLDDEVAFQVHKLTEENGGALDIAFNFKLGVDGSSGFQTLVEEFEEFQEETTAMTATNFVALNIWCVVNNKLEVIWHNPLFNSNLAVRPKQHLYRREDDVLDEVLDELKEEMANLQPIEWSDGVKVKLVPFFSMNDGKVMNHLHGNNWTNACPICYAGPDKFLDINSVYCANPDALAEMCLSTLHFGPRVMENLLKVGFNQQFKQWQATTDEEKQLKEESKEHIIKEVKRVLKVDVFRGQSNTGNCARTLFKNSIFFADLIGVDEDLIHRIYMLWIALTSSLPIDPRKFYDYCQETKDLYYEQCGWYSMSPTLHKVLEHGHLILELIPPELTAGMLSEEPAEASNKDTKRFQKYHAYQGNSEKKNEQVFLRMMDRSDPYMQSLFFKEHIQDRSKNEEIPEDVLAMCYSAEDLQNRKIVSGGEPSKAQESSFSFFSNV